MDLFDKLNVFFESKSQLFLIISLIGSLFFALLLFNNRISEGGDDSAYIYMDLPRHSIGSHQTRQENLERPQRRYILALPL